jgi:hypothetical protein
MLDRDTGEATKVADVERQEVGDAINVHRGYQTGIMDLHPRNG